MVEHQQSRAVGVFSDRETAEQALTELKSSGFPMEHVSLLAKQVEPDETIGDVEASDRLGDQKLSTPLDVVSDTVTNATWGTVLVGLTSLVIPGAGPILAAGSLGAALVAGVAGTGLSAVSINNLTNTIADLGIPKEQARVYSDHLLQGDYLTIVDGTEEEIQQAETILGNQGIEDWGIYPANA